MANDFSGDANCVALYNLESGALTTDSKATNTLTDLNTVQEDTTNYKQGSCSGYFLASNGEELYRLDADLSAGFPLKNSGGTNVFSICFWIRITESESNRGIISKSNSSGYGIAVRTFSSQIYFYRGVGNDPKGFGTAFTADRWYHVGFTLNQDTYRIRIWDDYNSALLGPDATGTYSAAFQNSDRPLEIGNEYNAGSLTGNLDEVVFFTDILTADEIDQIRAGTYGAGGTTLAPTTLPTTLAPTTLPTTLAPTTLPTTLAPTTIPTTLAPTTIPTTLAPTTIPTTLTPTTLPTTLAPTTVPTTLAPTTIPTTLAPTTIPTTLAPTTIAPTTIVTTLAPTTIAPSVIVDDVEVDYATTVAPTTIPTTIAPTTLPTTLAPTTVPTTLAPTTLPTTLAPTTIPTTIAPTTLPTTLAPTTIPTTIAPTTLPTTLAPTTLPTTIAPTTIPTTLAPTTLPTTLAPTTVPTTVSPTTLPTTVAPTTVPTTVAPTTFATTIAPTTTLTTAAPTTLIAPTLCTKTIDSIIFNPIDLISGITPTLYLESIITKEISFHGNLCR